jgi:hypothetical protein
VFFERREITLAFDGTFRLQNRFIYTNLSTCRFTWKLAQLPTPGGPAARWWYAARYYLYPGLLAQQR